MFLGNFLSSEMLLFVLSFQNACIVLDEYQVVMHSSDSIAPVGVLHPLAFHLESKVDVQCLRSDKTHEICMEKQRGVFEVQDCLDRCETTSKPVDYVSDLLDVTEHKFSISRTKNKSAFSICCWLQASHYGYSSSTYPFCFFLRTNSVASSTSISTCKINFLG